MAKMVHPFTVTDNNFEINGYPFCRPQQTVSHRLLANTGEENPLLPRIS